MMDCDGFVLHLGEHGTPAADSEEREEAKNIQQADEIAHGLI
jgi:hypothetical protein